MKQTSSILGAALLICGIVAVLLSGEVREQRERNALLLARVEALEAGRMASSGPRSVATVNETSAAAMAAPIAAVTGPSPGQDGENVPFAAMLRQSMDTEAGREFTRTMMATSLAQEYPDVGAELGLSTGQVDRLFQMLARHRTDVGIDRVGMLTGSADRASREEAMRSIAAAEQANEAQLSELLGADYPRWKEYQRNAAVRQREESTRRQTAEFRAAVSAGRPIDDAQFESLRAAIAEEERRIQMESRGLAGTQQLQRLSADHQRLADVASRYLDAQQLQGYQRHLRQQGDMQRMLLGTLAAMGEEDAPAGPPAGPARPDGAPVD